EGEVFDFSLEVEDEEQTNIGREVLGGVTASGKGKTSSKKNIPQTPQPGSDSDVRLVGDDDFSLEVDSGVQLTDTPKPGQRQSKVSPTGKTGARGSKLKTPS